jgi:hypothetical protein
MRIVLPCARSDYGHLLFEVEYGAQGDVDYRESAESQAPVKSPRRCGSMAWSAPLVDLGVDFG